MIADPIRDHYTVTADGQRFLVPVPVGDSANTRSHVVTNWASLRTRSSVTIEYVIRPTADAQRFLVVEPIDEETERPLTVVLGWQALLRR